MAVKSIRPMVSFIVPSHNRANVIQQTIDSILAQTYTNFEAIFIDDASTDNTAEVISAACKLDNRLRLIQNNTNLGAAKSRNIALGYAIGEYVNFVDSDDILAPEKLEVQLALTDEQTVDFVLCQVKRFSGSEPVGEMVDYGSLTDEISVMNYIGNVIGWSTIAPLWRREFLDQIGYFSESLTCFQDWELNVRALAQQPEVGVTQSCLGYYRNSWSGQQLSSRRDAKFAIGLYESRVLAKQILSKNRIQISSVFMWHFLAVLNQCRINDLKTRALKAFFFALQVAPTMRSRYQFIRSLLYPSKSR